MKKLIIVSVIAALGSVMSVSAQECDKPCKEPEAKKECILKQSERPQKPPMEKFGRRGMDKPPRMDKNRSMKHLREGIREDANKMRERIRERHRKQEESR